MNLSLRVAGFISTRLEILQNTISRQQLIVASALALAGLAGLNVSALLTKIVLATHSSSSRLIHAPSSGALAAFSALAVLVVASLLLALLTASC
jgi:hypothetical protein